MSTQILRLVLMSCLLSVLCIGIYGCYKSTPWPAMVTGGEATTGAPAAAKVKPAATALQKSAETPEDPAVSREKVKQNSERFYAAMNNMFEGNAEPMSEVWSHAPDITYVDSFGTMYVGWPSIEETLKRFAKTKTGSRVSAADLEINLRDELAYTWCIENWRDKTGDPNGTKLHANNVFRRENSEWKLIHHHNDQGLAVKKAKEKQKEEYLK